MKKYGLAVVSLVVRLWLAMQWIEAGYHKLTGGFDASGFMKGALTKAAGDHPDVQSWYASFITHFALPNVDVFNVLIPCAEILVGVGLIVGLATIPALIGGAFMNLNFMLAGTVSTNPILFAVAIILLFIGKKVYFFGLDRFAIPYLSKKMKEKREEKKLHHA